MLTLEFVHRSIMLVLALWLFLFRMRSLTITFLKRLGLGIDSIRMCYLRSLVVCSLYNVIDVVVSFVPSQHWYGVSLSYVT